MIKSLHLINWRSHKDTRLEFRKGTNLLVGIMGAGKSSVLEAISFALYGTFPALERRKVKLEHLIRLNEPSAKVTIEFDNRGSTYRVERTIEKKTTAELFKDGQLIEHGTAPVSKHVSDVLQVDYDLFTRAIFSEQNNIEHFLRLDPRKRKEEIDSLLGLDRFETARSNVTTAIGRIRAKRQALETHFSREKLREQQQKQKQHREKISLAEAQLKQQQELLEKKNQELSSHSSSFDKMNKEREQSEQLEKQTIQLSAQCESLQKEIKDVDRQKLEASKAILQRKLQEKSKLSETLKSITERNISLSKQAGSLQSEIKLSEQSHKKAQQLKKQLSELLNGDSEQSLQSKQKELEQSLLQCQSERTSTEQQISETSEVLDKLKPGTSECPLCSSPISEKSFDHIRQEKQKFIEEKKKRITSLSGILEKHQKENSQLKSKIQKITELSSALASIEIRDVDSLKSGAEQLNRQITALADERRSHEAKFESVSREIEKLREEVTTCENILKKTKQLEQLSEQLSRAKEKLSSVSFDKEKFEDLRRKIESCRLDMERASSAVNSLETGRKMSEDLLKMVAADIEKLQLTESEIRGLSRLEEQLSVYKNALLETQTSLRSNLSEAITAAMNELWHMFYPYHNYRALRLNVTDRDYLFEVDDGEWKPIDIIASGGERASAALTLRVALAMVLTPNLSWLVLDEPTHNLDTNAVEMLSSALQLKVPEVVNQIFLITHDEAFMGSDFAMSYKLSRDKQNNGETKIEII